MTTADFIPAKIQPQQIAGSFTWSAPSNIALVKYWGKKAHQIPANPSLSFTLKNCKTNTSMHYAPKEDHTGFSFEFLFEGQPKPSFHPKIQKFLERIATYCPYLTQYHLQISSENTFPHSSGIASSASGMSALALNIMSLERALNPEMTQTYFHQKASFLARLGSGSACRSVEGPIVTWGTHQDISNSSDLYGTKFTGDIHPVYHNFQDTILLVDKGEKQVSSTVGHDLMHQHPFAAQRFEQAHTNLKALKGHLQTGDLNAFISLVESEALTLHAMMMTSQPYFILMKPNTLEIINKIWAYRADTNIPLCFTLDAGANVHLLYPQEHKAAVREFISSQLAAHCQNNQFIHDELGDGAQE